MCAYDELGSRLSTLLQRKAVSVEHDHHIEYQLCKTEQVALLPRPCHCLWPDNKPGCEHWVCLEQSCTRLDDEGATLVHTLRDT